MMIKLTSDFQLLKPLLKKVVKSEELIEADQQTINSFRGSSTYSRLPRNPEEAERNEKVSLFLLKQAADSLAALCKGDIVTAFQEVQKTINLKLRVDPFRGFFYRFAAKVAKLAKDTNTFEMFENRYKVYRETYNLESALLGVAHIFDPEVREYLDEMLREKDQSYLPLKKEEGKLEFLPPTIKSVYAGQGEKRQSPSIKIFNKPELAQFINFDSELTEFEPVGRFIKITFKLKPHRKAMEVLKALGKNYFNGEITFIYNSEEHKTKSFSKDEVEKMIFSGSKILTTLKQPISWLELGKAINWEELWFSLSEVVIIP